MNRKKSTKIKRRMWDVADMEEALAAVRRREMSIRQASRTFSVPLTTLSDRVAGRVTRETPGPDPVLTKAEENRLAMWILSMNSIGHGPTRVQVCEMVKQILDANKRPNPFIDNLPGRGWHASFLKRHPEVKDSYHKSSNPSTPTSSKKLEKWFREYQETISRLGLDDKPHLIWNCGETSFPFEPDLEWAVTPASSRFHEGDKDGANGKGKKKIATLCAISAAGAVTPPSHIYQKSKWDQRSAVPCTYFMRHSSGWTDSHLFQLWLTEHFAEHAPNERPILILFDGHSSFIDKSTRAKALDNEIEFLCLPPHLVRQPIDVGLFNPLKMNWWRSVEDFKAERGGKKFHAKTFINIFKTSWEDTVRLGDIFEGFRSTGIFPPEKELLGTVKRERLSSLRKGGSPLRVPELFISNSVVLRALEEAMPAIQVELFEKRYSVGFQGKDPLYYTWKNLKMKVCSSQEEEEEESEEDSSGSSSSSDGESSNDERDEEGDNPRFTSQKPPVIPIALETAAYEEVQSQSYNNVIRLKRKRKQKHISRYDDDGNAEVDGGGGERLGENFDHMIMDTGSPTSPHNYLQLTSMNSLEYGTDSDRCVISSQEVPSVEETVIPLGTEPQHEEVVVTDGTILPSSSAASNGLNLDSPPSTSVVPTVQSVTQNGGQVGAPSSDICVIPVALEVHETLVVRQHAVCETSSQPASVSNSTITATENEAADALVTVSMLDPESLKILDGAIEVASDVEVMSTEPQATINGNAEDEQGSSSKIS